MGAHTKEVRAEMPSVVSSGSKPSSTTPMIRTLGVPVSALAFAFGASSPKILLRTLCPKLNPLNLMLVIMFSSSSNTRRSRARISCRVFFVSTASSAESVVFDRPLGDAEVWLAA
eukprot:scaffold351_cov248-Pinguiococcus_pyrenoidosus.AAC.12